LPTIIFGKIRPKLAVFTTPNCEFNVMFNMSIHEFRHNDHKFEWTRDQFRQWYVSLIEYSNDHKWLKYSNLILLSIQI